MICTHGAEPPARCALCEQRYQRKLLTSREWKNRNPDTNKAINEKWFLENKTHRTEYHKRRYAADPERFKLLAKKQAMTNEERGLGRTGAIYPAGTNKKSWIAAQNNRCKICEKEPFANNPLCGDHDATRPGVVNMRGILHRTCNSGLGLYDHDPKRFRRAAAYLEDPKLDPLDYVWDF